MQYITEKLTVILSQTTDHDVVNISCSLPRDGWTINLNNVKQLLLICAVVGQPLLAIDKKPLIANPIIEKVIRAELKKPIGNLTETDLSKIKHLNLRGKELTDLGSLTGLSELEGLSLGNNKVKDLSALKHLKKLKELRLDDNRLYNINTLPELGQLRALFLENNAITDLRPILRLKNLTSLSVGGHDQNDFDTIWKLNNLKVLSISGSGINNQQLAVVANELPDLKHLFICNNPKISNLLPLATFKKLEILDVDDRPNLRIQIETLQKSLPKLKARYYAP